MSMSAIFVQVDDAEITGFEAGPDSVEALFELQGPPTEGLLSASSAMQERLRAVGPDQMAAAFSRLPEPLRQQIEASLGRTSARDGFAQG